MEFLKRTEILIGKENIEKLQNSNVAVFGVGGVGGYVVETLARSGIGKITIVDFDTISISNINRQIIATSKNVDNSKVLEWKKRINEINPICEVNALNVRFTKDNANDIISQNFSYVIDAIDSVCDKIELIKFCQEKSLNIISSMGAGNRFCLPEYQICDIYKTENDGLAKVIRKKCRENGIKHLTVAYTKQSPVKSSEKVVGSIAYHPATCGILIASYVVNQLIGEQKYVRMGNR